MLKTDTTLPKVVSLVAGGFSGSWSEFWFLKAEIYLKNVWDTFQNEVQNSYLLDPDPRIHRYQWKMEDELRFDLTKTNWSFSSQKPWAK